MILDFFKENYSEVIGAYFDGEKIYLSRRLNDKVETDEVNLTLEDGVSEIEQVAEKIYVTCAKHGWKTSKLGFCLREGQAITLQSPLDNIPPKEIDNAVKSFAVSQVGKNPLYAFIKEKEDAKEILMMTISRATAAEYISAFKKNSMNLCALTVLPLENNEKAEFIKPQTFAEYAAEVTAVKKTPNLIADRLSVWNYKKISLSIAAIFFCIISVVFGSLFYEYQTASAQVDEVQARVDSLNDTAELKKIVDADTAEMKRINSLCAAQINSAAAFNSLVNVGRSADGSTYLRKLKIAGNSLELEGFTDNPDEIKNYVNRLKKFVAPNVKTGNLTSTDGITNFIIHVTLNK